MINVTLKCVRVCVILIAYYVFVFDLTRQQQHKYRFQAYNCVLGDFIIVYADALKTRTYFDANRKCFSVETIQNNK